MIVAGVMSGTSADGVDVAVCRIGGRGDRVKLLGLREVPYSSGLRRAVLAAMNAEAVSVASLSRLHWRLGEVYADAVEGAASQCGVAIELVGCHGQTVFHQGAAARFLGTSVRATWQIGEASVIAERMRCPVVSDLRPADLAAGGQGAPLVAMLDVAMLGHRTRNRVLQNLGGIGNVTAIPAGMGAAGAMAFDTGPGNMVIDGCMEKLYGRRFDRDGAVGRRGKVLSGVVKAMLAHPYLAASPPKTCGREQFGREFVDGFVAACEGAGGKKADAVATATAFTAATVLEGYRRFVWGHLGQRAPLAVGTDFVVAGGGARNGLLMEMLRGSLEPLGLKVRESAELGVPAQAKEAMAFALLAWLTWHRRTGNVPLATGAGREVVLGKVTFG